MKTFAQVIPAFSVVCRGLMLMAIAMLSAGCINKDMTDLENFVNEIKSQKSVPIGALPEFPTDQIYLYTAFNRRDPFESFEKPSKGSEEMEAVMETAQQQRPCRRPDMHRNREHLEQFPLDSLNMVGTLTPIDGEVRALVVDNDGLLHRIKVGNYLGKNHGKVIAITDAAVSVIEMVSDGTGCYVDREAALKIKEK